MALILIILVFIIIIVIAFLSAVKGGENDEDSTLIDDTQTIVKWVTDAGVPSCVSSLTTKGAYMTHDEALELMATTAWTDPTPMH